MLQLVIALVKSLCSVTRPCVHWECLTSEIDIYRHRFENLAAPKHVVYTFALVPWIDDYYVFDESRGMQPVRVNQRPKITGLPHRNEQCTPGLADFQMANSGSDQTYRWTQPIVLVMPISGKCVHLGSPWTIITRIELC